MLSGVFDDFLAACLACLGAAVGTQPAVFLSIVGWQAVDKAARAKGC